MEDIIVLYPSPGAGHMGPLMEFGKLIARHHPTVSISILLTAPEGGGVIGAAPKPDDIDAGPSITFHHLTPIPHPDPSSTPVSPQGIYFDLARRNNPSLRRTLLGISEATASSKRTIIRALVIDFFCCDALEVSADLHIPTYFLYISSAHGLGSLLHLPATRKSYDPEAALKHPTYRLRIPAFPPLRVSDAPLPWLDRGNESYEHFSRTAKLMAESSGIVVNTFDSLESDAIKALREGQCVPGAPTPPIFCVGPLIRAPLAPVAGGLNRHNCLTWLDSQPEKSVAFLCFGSLGRFSAPQLKEMAAGLEKSGVRFLWVVRDPPGNEAPSLGSGLESLLPEGFLERTRERGLVVRPWVPQSEVLSHGSVGGFVTHCGWNSVLESVCAGVPLAAWPLYAEQKINRVFLAKELRLALPVSESENGFVSADELAQRVRELVDSEEGRALRVRAVAAKEGAEAALRDGGSSVVELEKFVASLHLQK